VPCATSSGSLVFDRPMVFAQNGLPELISAGTSHTLEGRALGTKNVHSIGTRVDVHPQPGKCPQACP
jgi:hypothetical protein